MAEADMIVGQAMPTAQAVPLSASATRAEVLHTLRKQGLTRKALIPSRGRAKRDRLGRGYDLIHQVLPATNH
jgi:hypothetical protein